MSDICPNRNGVNEQKEHCISPPFCKSHSDMDTKSQVHFMLSILKGSLFGEQHQTVKYLFTYFFMFLILLN